MKKARHKWVTVHLRGTLSEECFLEDWESIERELAAELLQEETSQSSCAVGGEMVG